MWCDSADGAVAALRAAGTPVLVEQYSGHGHRRAYVADPGGNWIALVSKEARKPASLIPASPPLPQPVGDITTCHDAAITPATTIPPNSGERLDLHLAIWIAFANARTKVAA